MRRPQLAQQVEVDVGKVIDAIEPIRTLRGAEARVRRHVEGELRCELRLERLPGVEVVDVMHDKDAIARATAEAFEREFAGRYLLGRAIHRRVFYASSFLTDVTTLSKASTATRSPAAGAS